MSARSRGGGVLLGLGGFSLVRGGVCLVPGEGSPWSGGVCLVPGGRFSGDPPVNRMNDRHM